MNRQKREPDYPVELESQFILRLPDEPAKALRELLKSGENFKNRFTLQMDNDMRHGEVRLDHWLLHGKLVDLPTIIESLKTIDRKSVYKTADICQMMICKEEMEQPAEEESPTKNKKKDPFKVDKKFLFPHGLTPPTKNVRKRRFRKTLKKKCMEAPEIEKEVKRLLRADNEAVSFTWEIIQEEDDSGSVKNEPAPPAPEKAKTKKEHNVKKETNLPNQASKVEDIFGGALSDSDVEDENVNVDIDSRLSYDDAMSDTNSIQGPSEFKGNRFATQFKSEMFVSPQKMHNISQPSTSASTSRNETITSFCGNNYGIEEYMQRLSTDNSNVSFKMQKLVAELEELKQRRQRTQLEIAGMENMTLRQRFQEILLTLNKDIKMKEMEYQNLQSSLK